MGFKQNVLMTRWDTTCYKSTVAYNRSPEAVYTTNGLALKGIVSDSNNIFFYFMNQKILIKNIIPKVSVDSNFTFTSYAWFMCIGTALQTTIYCVKLSLVDEALCKKRFSFHKEMISAYFLWGNVLLGGELQKDEKNLNYLRVPAIWNLGICL